MRLTTDHSTACSSCWRTRANRPSIEHSGFGRPRPHAEVDDSLGLTDTIPMSAQKLVSSPVATVRVKKGPATKQRILQAAVDLFAMRSFDDVQVDEIAARAEVAHGLVFHHFGNKRALYLEAVREISRRIFERPQRDSTLPPHKLARKILREHFQHVADNKLLMIAYVRGSTTIQSDPEAWAVLEADRNELTAYALELFGLDPQSAVLRTIFTLAAVAMDTLGLRWLEEGQSWDVETQLVEATIELFIGSFRAAARIDPSLNVEPAIKRIQKRSQ